MKGKNRKKIGLDIGIMVLACASGVVVWRQQMSYEVFRFTIITATILISVALLDILMIKAKKVERVTTPSETGGLNRAHELILLDEQDKPIKSWELAGKTALVIGRMDKEKEVEVDLSECEFSAFIDSQHAVLNFALDCWYVEDLDSHNGVKVKKVIDGMNYKVTQSRPCRITPGDVIYIANTKLLFT